MPTQRRDRAAAHDTLGTASKILLSAHASAAGSIVFWERLTFPNPASRVIGRFPETLSPQGPDPSEPLVHLALHRESTWLSLYVQSLPSWRRWRRNSLTRVNSKIATLRTRLWPSAFL